MLEIVDGKMEGRCLCGGVTLRVEGRHDPRPGACHCGLCQAWSGGVFLAFMAEAEAVTVTGTVGRFASSTLAERAFCPTCGSHLWMRDTSRPDAPYDLMPGLFRDLRNAPLQSEIYADRAPAYVSLAGDHATATRAEWEAKHPFVEGDMP